MLPLLAGAERAVAATKTYTASLGALAMLSAALEGDAARWAELERVPALVAAAIEANAALEEKVARYRYAEHFVVVGRGFNYSTAFEIALKMKETSYLVAEPYSPADLLHGPVAMIDRGFPALVVAASGRVLADLASLVDKLDERHAELVAISDDAARPRPRPRGPAPAARRSRVALAARGRRPGPALRGGPRPHARPRPRPTPRPQQGHRDALSRAVLAQFPSGQKMQTAGAQTKQLESAAWIGSERVRIDPLGPRR